MCGPLDGSAASSVLDGDALLVGVLALQGAFREHRSALERVGARPLEVRRPEHIKDLDGLVIPGGESSTMAKLMLEYGLDDAIRRFSHGGGPVWGTCAGAIVVASVIEDYPEQPRLALLDMRVSRNAYGRQRESFEADISVMSWEQVFRAPFIRAPRIEAVGGAVQVLATFGGRPVAVADDSTLATVFHPELTGDDRWHRAFVTHCSGVRDARRRAAGAADAAAASGHLPMLRSALGHQAVARATAAVREARVA